MRMKKAFQISILLLFVASYILPKFYIFNSRELPPEPDDTYSYILQASLIENDSFFMDKPAIASLRKQINENLKSKDNKKKLIAERQYHRILYRYVPLYSYALFQLKTTFSLSYEKSFEIISYIGSILLSVSIILFIYSLFGIEATTIAVFLLSFIIFPQSGNYYFRPYSFSLSFAFMFLAYINLTKKVNPLISLLFVLIISSIHLGGKYISVLMLIIVFFTHQKSISKHLSILVMFVCIVFFFSIPYFYPMFKMELGSLIFFDEYFLQLANTFANLGMNITRIGLGIFTSVGLFAVIQYYNSPR